MTLGKADITFKEAVTIQEINPNVQTIKKPSFNTIFVNENSSSQTEAAVISPKKASNIIKTVKFNEKKNKDDALYVKFFKAFQDRYRMS